VTGAVTVYDDPAALAALVAAAERPLLVGLDVDGVLAPLVDHADDAELLDGMSDAVSAVAVLESVHVAVVSGRSLEGLVRFGFGPDVRVIGSHGMEVRDRAMVPLDAIETDRLASLDALAVVAAARAGDGAWVERKPASVVLHVRRADPERGHRALSELGSRSRTVEGATCKGGSNVLELFARAADKGTALVAVAADVGARSTVFVGDDVTDEDAFARLGAGDLTVKVGDGETIASHRLPDPASVLEFLRAFAARSG